MYLVKSPGHDSYGMNCSNSSPNSCLILSGNPNCIHLDPPNESGTTSETGTRTPPQLSVALTKEREQYIYIYKTNIHKILSNPKYLTLTSKNSNFTPNTHLGPFDVGDDPLALQQLGYLSLSNYPNKGTMFLLNMKIPRIYQENSISLPSSYSFMSFNFQLTFFFGVKFKKLPSKQHGPRPSRP